MEHSAIQCPCLPQYDALLVFPGIYHTPLRFPWWLDMNVWTWPCAVSSTPPHCSLRFVSLGHSRGVISSHDSESALDSSTVIRIANEPLILSKSVMIESSSLTAAPTASSYSASKFNLSNLLHHVIIFLHLGRKEAFTKLKSLFAILFFLKCHYLHIELLRMKIHAIKLVDAWRGDGCRVHRVGEVSIEGNDGRS